MGIADLFLSQNDKSTLSEDAAKVPERETYAILFVDDEPQILKAMLRVFRRENYRLLTADSPQKALEILAANKIHVVISDHRMPQKNGAVLLAEIKQKYPQTIRIMLTGYADVDAVMGAVNQGAVYKFITKPWHDQDLRLTVSLALEQYDLIKENRKLKTEQKRQQKNITKLNSYLNLNRSQLGGMLLKERLIDKKDLEKAKATQAKTKGILPKILVDMGVIKEKAIMELLQSTLGIKRVHPAEFQVPVSLARMVPKELCEKNLLVPLKKSGRKLMVAMADPSDYMKIDDIRFMTGIHLDPVIASHREITDKITEIYGQTDDKLFDMENIEEFDLSDPTEAIEIIIDKEDEESDLDELLAAKDKPPAIRMVNAVISDALRHNASDVHISPKTKYVMIRYRIDGLLQDKIHVPLAMHPAIISRIKIMAELDIAERRRPQDGRVTVKTPTKMVDMRLSTLPTINGEKVVLRILDRNSPIKAVSEIGLSPAQLSLVTKIIKKPQGCILATGPTGSGKTSTLYSLIQEHASIEKNHVTIEDPVEYYMSVAEQVMVKDKIGLTFPIVLRTILRQDPDVIMLGEIRDFETAEVTLHAALTGHTVLSTLHTNSGLATMTRLMDMGIKPHVLSYALNGIISQRLVREICPACKEDDPSAKSVMALLNLDNTYSGIKPKKGKGCDRCNQTGYKGRTGIFEVLTMTQEIKHLIQNQASEPELEAAVRQGGNPSLFDSGMDKVVRGITTCDEILRVLGPQKFKDFRCKNCKKGIQEHYRFCPHCGNAANLKCRKCNQPLKPSWPFCPGCGRKIQNALAKHKESLPKNKPIKPSGNRQG